jgi:hypothetical protein
MGVKPRRSKQNPGSQAAWYRSVFPVATFEKFRNGRLIVGKCIINGAICIIFIFTINLAIYSFFRQ